MRIKWIGAEPRAVIPATGQVAYKNIPLDVPAKLGFDLIEDKNGLWTSAEDIDGGGW
jgi:hypothetical protein